jgi:hypothetical protein
LKENYLDIGVRSVVKLIPILLDETKGCITDIAFIIYDLNEEDPADEKLEEKLFSKKIYNKISGEKLLEESLKKIRDRDNEGEKKSIEEFSSSEFGKLIK